MKAIKKYIKRSQTGSKKAARLILRAEKKLSRTLDDEALRDLAREERRVKTRSKEGLSAAQAEDFKLKKRITEAAREQFTDAEWVKLDNAALIFPSTTRADKNNLFRVSVLLKEKVEPLILQKALNFLVPRFPAVTSAVKRGFFWYYLEPSTHPLTVEKDVDFPCRKIPLDSRHSSIRVLFYENRISVDFFHVATDGNGGLTFVNSLLACYLKLKYDVEIKDKNNCPDFRDKPKREEMVDSFLQMADLKTPKAEKDVVAYAVKGTRLTPYSSCVIMGTMSAKKVVEAAHSAGCTVTELITACIIWATEQNRIFYGYSKKLPVAVSVPCNLKRYFPSPTLRNFIAVMPVINDGSVDFQAVLDNVKAQFEKKNNKEFFMGVINFNVKSQLNPLIKMAPLVIKDLALRYAIRRFGDRVRTSTFSNLGVAKAPREFEEFVERYEFSLGPQVRETTGWSAVTYKDNFVLCAARTIVESNIERLVFSKLAELGLDVTIETNCEV
ncbi:MAG: hypothetical protein ACLU1U_06185 [Lachnospiraceae bacterium]